MAKRKLDVFVSDETMGRLTGLAYHYKLDLAEMIDLLVDVSLDADGNWLTSEERTQRILAQPKLQGKG